MTEKLGSETIQWAFAVMTENHRLKSELAIVRAEAYEQAQELLELQSEYEDLRRELDIAERALHESEETQPSRALRPEAVEGYSEGISHVEFVDRDDITLIPEVDQVTADLLSALGIQRFEQLADMTRPGWSWLAQFIPALRRREERYRWATYARLLASNPDAAVELADAV